MKMVMIYTACATIDECKEIARALVQKNAAACVNILSPNLAVYRWKGKIEETEETPMIIKTRQANQDEAVRIIKSMHSYETPGIVCWDADSLHADYSQWMTENLKDFI